MTTAHMGHLFLMSLYISVLHTIPAPANLTIVSRNFRHILQWNPGIGSPPGTVFSLRQRCDKRLTTWRKIRNTTVDVSETVGSIYDRCTFTVWAALGNTTSAKVHKSFTPYEDTIIGPPIVVLSGCGDCLNISISIPIETRITYQIRQFTNSLTFNISWKKAEKSEAEHISISSKHHVLKNLQTGHQYCVSVLPETSSNSNTRPSDWQCEYTSKEEPRGVLYVMSWSLGAAVLGLCLLVLALGLVYTGSLWKLKNPLPKSLSNIVQAHYLITEQTLYDRVSTEAISASKNYPTKNNKSPKVEDSENRQHEENYINKADTEDEEDYEEEEEGNYMGCVIDNSGPETNKSKEKAVVSTSPLHNSSGICPAVEETHHDELECENEFISGVFEDRSRHLPQSKGKEDGSGNINLFSVTLRALGPQEEEEEEEVCKPLLATSIHELPTSDISEEQTEEELPQEAEETDIQTEINSDVEEDTTSGYMVTHTGDMYEQNKYESEESDYDTDYITR